MRAGFVGTGAFAREHASSLKRCGVTVAACYGTNREKTGSFCSDFGATAFDDPVAMLESGTVDVLYLVVPPYALDGRVEFAAVKHRIPFLCEKPVGLDGARCREIAAEVVRTGLVTSSGYWLRTGTASAEVKAVCRRNRVAFAHSMRVEGFPPAPWLKSRAKSGGPMVEVGTHSVDYLRFLLGEVVQVFASTHTGILSSRHRGCDIDDVMDAQIVFASGAIGHVAVSRLLENGAGLFTFVNLFGDNFMLEFNQPWDGAVIRVKEGSEDWRTFVVDRGRFDAHNRVFLAAIDNHTPDAVTGSYPDAVKTLEVTLAMVRSAETGKPVTLRGGS